MNRNRALLFFFLFLIPATTFAKLESQFVFNGQNAEQLKMEKEITILKPRTVEVPSTCYRQVPVGTEEVCDTVTRYRQECQWVPGTTACRTEYERVCRPVSRTREECSRGSSRTVCSENPGREVCTNNPGREVCTERPTREVCRTAPNGQQVCNTVGGGRHCTNVGGGRECRTVGGGRECREVPGEQICRTVTYSDTDCDSVPRQRCENIPGRNECSNIPYSAQECRDEVRYESQSYACTRTETVNDRIVKTIKSEVEVQIITNGLVEEFPVGISVKEESNSYEKFNLSVKLLKQPKVIVVLKKKDIKVAQSGEKEIKLKGQIVLEVLEEKMLPISFPVSILKASIEKKSSKMMIVFEGAISALGEVDFEITHKARLSSKKTLVALKAEYPSEKIQLVQLEDKVGLQLDIKDAIKHELKKSNMLLKLKLASPLNLQGEIMNEMKPDTSKLYEGTFVELK